MSKSRIIGAGCAGSSIYNCNVNLNTAGGTKKQGLPFSLDGVVSFDRKYINIRAYGANRNVIFTMNQLGGVSSSSFASNAHNYAVGDGVHRKAPYKYTGGGGR